MDEPTTPSHILYKTFSLCPRCALLEKKSDLVLKAASMIEKHDKIWLSVSCNIHGQQESLITSHATWFKNMWKKSGKEMATCGIEDAEELKKRRILRQATLPLVVELSIFSENRFVSNEDIDSQLRKINIKYPRGLQYILKITGRMSGDMAALNELILHVHSKTTPATLMMIQVSYERLCILVKLPNCCFLKGRIYPNVIYYLKQGDEKQCMVELGQTFAALKRFTGLKLIVSLVVETPVPDLSTILAWIRRQIGFVQFIEIIVERSSQTLIDSIANSRNDYQKQLRVNGNVYTDIIDPMDILKAIEEYSQGTIAVDDFFPGTVSSAMEPFLPMFGYGKYQIRPSPHCSYGVCLVNTENYHSVPISRIVNFEKLYFEMQKILPELLKDNVSLGTYLSLKTILDDSTLKGVKLPNLISFMTDKDKLSQVAEFTSSLQFVVVQNHMNLTNIDMVRRCDAAALAKGNDGATFYASSCNYYL